MYIFFYWYFEYSGAVTAESAAPIPLPSCDNMHSYCAFRNKQFKRNIHLLKKTK